MSALRQLTQQLTASPSFARRLLHGRGRAVEGWEQVNIEWYPPYLFVQNFEAELSAPQRDVIQKLFEDHETIMAVFLQQRAWPDVSTQVLHQRQATTLPWEGWVALSPEVDVAISLGKNRNTGAFLDMRAGWHWLREHAEGKKVLNLFCYTGVFSLFALKGGAQRVDNMDMAANVLKIAQRNHQHNQVHDGSAAFYKRDILKSARWFESRHDYDLIILDPPPYQKKAFHGWQDYQKLLRLVRGSLTQGGQLFCCLNNPQTSITEFEQALRDTFDDLTHLEIVPTAEEITEQDAEKGLKTIVVTF
ncbi:MAG: class I SAM-dependent methyltransferase [Oleiphilaceae bacterium]|nr:class I SAM-dependent methyltransferase [Oleiphilaceae bacterium]